MIRGNVSALIVDGVAAYAVLTGPDTVAVMVGRMSADTALRALREPDGFVAGAAALPPVAPWVDPRLVDPISPVHAMSGINNSLRLPLRDGRPLLLGVHSVGDALSTTNPFFGRGISLAMLHAQTVADGIAAEADPSLAQAELIGAQLADVAQAHWNDAVYMDRARRAGWRAALGLPAPQAAPAMGVPFAAAAADAEVWVRVIREMQLLDRPGSVREDSALQARIASLDLPAPPPVATRKDVLAALDNNPH
jgi:2-polyprenyl-6-methoxyphenol hydroxylase-like FAD-dependent oxidoreductase